MRPEARKVLEEYGNEKITQIEVHREPLGRPQPPNPMKASGKKRLLVIIHVQQG